MSRLAYLVAAVGGAAAGVVGVLGMGGAAWTLRTAAVVPLGGLELAMDPLAGLFLALTGLATLFTSIYAVGYRTGSDGAAAYLVFVGALAMVPVAANAITCLIAWELMSLASWILVLDRRDTAEARWAGWVYAVMTHVGLACLLVGMLLLAAHSGSLRFADWRAGAAALSPGVRDAAFILLALGFAGKAGVIPLHVWLPLAHPAAPSHVSALMSGVMVKLGVLGLLRAAFEWTAPGPAWWGVTLLLLGAVSAVVGILYALVEVDLKRLLAFSSIENVGVILIGVGAALVFGHVGADGVAGLALLAALYHTINHAAFKTLLFLCAGAVVQATGTRTMEAYGGLIKRMPWTAACFLVGAIAIAALPPLNGFVSEWLTFQALMRGVTRSGDLGTNLACVTGIAGLALTAGLTAACFVKAFGITFLALPRREMSSAVSEASRWMCTAMVGMAAACVVLGLGAGVVAPILARVADSIQAASAPPLHGTWLTFEVAGAFAALSPMMVALALAGGLVTPLIVLALTGSPRRVRPGETWGCGRLRQTARMEYTATAFADPYKRVFRFFYRPVRRLERDAHPAGRLFVRRIEYTNPARALIEDWLYRPVLGAIRTGMARAQGLQSGHAGAYLAYIFVVLLLLLVLA